VVSMTCEPVLDEPCPRVTVTVTGLSPGEHVVTVWRVADGERTPVRSARTLTVVDSFFVDDFEAPFNRFITYELEILSGQDASLPQLLVDTELRSDKGYIQDPLNPAAAVPVQGVRGQNGETYFRSDAFASIAYSVGASLFPVMGATRPVSIGGTRQAPSNVPLSISTLAQTENLRLRDLVQSATHLVIRPLPEWGDFIPGTATYLAETIEEQPVTVQMGGSLTRWVTSGTIVRSSSARVVIALWTYQDVAEIFATHDQKQTAATGFTYLEDQKNPANV
jgi:hypothetical protein